MWCLHISFVGLINWCEEWVSLISWALLSVLFKLGFSASPPRWSPLRKSQPTSFCLHIPSPASPSPSGTNHAEGLYGKEPCSTSALVLKCTISTLQFCISYSALEHILGIASSKNTSLTYLLCGLEPPPMCFQSLCA